MPETAVLLALVAIGCGTGIVCYFMTIVHSIITRRPVGPDVLSELKAIREELTQLRRQNNDVVLGLDTSVSRLEERMSHLETRLHADRPTTDERQRLGRVP